MKLLKTSILNGIAVAVKIASAFIINKLLAIYVGPSGYALIGQFQNGLSIISSLAGGIIVPGVTKIVAENNHNEEMLNAVYATISKFVLVNVLIIGFALLLFNKEICDWVFGGNRLVAIVLILIVPFITAYNISMAVVNAMSELKIYVLSGIAGSLISIIIIGLVAYAYQLIGVLFGLLILPIVNFIVLYVLIKNRSWFKMINLAIKANRAIYNELLKYALMGIVGATALPVTYIAIRDTIINSLGLDEAGYWQAMWKLSEIYLMMVTTTLTFYYIPKIAECTTGIELKKLIMKVFLFSVPVVIFAGLSLYILRFDIVEHLFTKHFLPMTELFGWQIIGDISKICSWVFGAVMIGRAKAKFFILSEIIFSGTFYTLSVYLMSVYGLIGVVIGYAANYFVHLLANITYVSYEVRRMPS